MLVVPIVCVMAWGLGSPRTGATPNSNPRRQMAATVLAQTNSQETVDLLPDFAPDLAEQLSKLEFAQTDSDNAGEARPALRLDDSGEAVERLQQQLQTAGFYDGEITGQFDLDTEAAVLAFQEQEGLQTDGIMGQESWDRLEAQQPTSDATPNPLNLDNLDSEAPREETSSGLGLIWWLAGGAVLVVVGGGLFIVLLRAFREEVDEDGGAENPLMSEEELSLSPALENSRDLTPSVPPNTTSLSQEPPLEAEIPSHNSPWETPEASPQPQTFPDLPVDIPPEPKKPVTPDGTAIAPQKSGSSALTRLPRMSIVEALILDLQHPDPERRRKAIWELGQRGDSRAITPLVDLLTDASSQERSTILAVLSEISARNLRPMKQALMVSLQDDSAEVRKNAIRDLTRIYDSIAQLSQVLRYGTDDTDPEVRETAKWAMSQLQRIRTLPLNTDGDDTP